MVGGSSCTGRMRGDLVLNSRAVFWTSVCFRLAPPVWGRHLRMLSCKLSMTLSVPRVARAQHLARLLLPFLSLQIGTQVASAIAGILVVRLLPVPDFAVYAIAVSVQASLTVLSDIGVSPLFLARAG